MSPLIAFGPSGALAVVGTAHGRSTSGGGEGYLSVRRAHGRFRPDVMLGPISYGSHGEPDPLGVAPATDGVSAVLFGSAANAPLDVELVSASGAVRVPQRLQGASFSSEGPGPYAHIAATRNGDIVVAGNTEGSQLFSASLAPGATTFSESGPLGALGSSNGDEAVITDPQSDAWIPTGDTPDEFECPGVAYRAAGSGRFTVTYSSSCGPQGTLSIDGLAASSRGNAAVLISQRVGNGQRLSIRTGNGGRFSHTATLGTVPSNLPSGFAGLAADRDGRYTIGWIDCSRSDTRCAIKASTGSTIRELGQVQTVLADVPGGPSGGGGLIVLVGDGVIVIQRCVKTLCELSASSVTAEGRFTTPVPIGTHARYSQSVGDDHGNVLLVYTQGQSVRATVRQAGHTSFTEPVRLPVSAANQGITAAYGPDGEAAVAWSGAKQTSVAVYDGPAHK